LQVNAAPAGIYEATVTIFVGMGNLAVNQSTAPSNGGPGCTTVLQYGVCEITFTYAAAGCASYVPAVTGCSGGTVTNPWENVTISATFTGQNTGLKYNIGGFYMGAGATNNGNQWAVRFSPPKADVWNYAAVFSSPTDYKTLVTTGLFTSTANPNAHGFLAVNNANRNILQTADSAAFYPFMFNINGLTDLGDNQVSISALVGSLGTGQAPPSGLTMGLPGAGDYLGPWATSGFNIARDISNTETTSWVISSLGVNNNVYLAGNGGVSNSVGSMTWDALLRDEAALGLHAWFTPVNNPYNLIPGGNVFASGATTQQYLHAWQYIINRFGAYVDVWELGNELAPVSGYMTTIAAWVKQQDPYSHLTAISYPGSGPIANLDLQSNHSYYVYSVAPTVTLAGSIGSAVQSQRAAIGASPIVYGELGQAGMSGVLSDPPYNSDFRQWENALFFNQAFGSPYPGGGCNGTGGFNGECVGSIQMAQMAISASFFNSIDPAATPLAITVAPPKGVTLTGYALGSATDLAGWIVNATNASTVSGATMRVTVPAANMAGEWIAPATGAVISTFTTAVSAGSQTFAIPSFCTTIQTCDIWFRIRSTASPVVMTNAAPGCLQGTICSLNLVAKGGTGAYNWAVTAGALPPGLTINGANGSITGQAAVAGNWNFAVVATDSSGGASPVQRLILVVYPPIAVGASQTNNLTVGASANIGLVITGGVPPVKCSVTGNSPPGIGYNGFCAGTGTPVNGGTYNFSVTGTDGNNNTAGPVTVTTSVNATTVGILNGQSNSGTVRTPYNWRIFAQHGTSPYTFTVSSGSLPNGLRISSVSSYGYVTGTPTTVGSTSFSLAVRDSAGNVSAAVPYTITINSAPYLAQSSVSGFVPGSAYYSSVGAGGGTAPLWCSVAGALPAGFLMDPASCEIYGTTAATGSFPVTVTVWDSAGASASAPYTLTSMAMINMNPPQTILFGALSDVISGTAFSLFATSSSGLPVGFASTTPDVCTVNVTSVTTAGSGICSIVASQVGDGSVGPALPVSQSLNVQAVGYSGPYINPGGVTPLFSASNSITPGSWVSIYGSNLAAQTAMWNGDFPTNLGGVTVTINGRQAYLSYVGPIQINLQAPDDATTGIVPVTVTNESGSWTAAVTLGQFSPSFDLFDATHVAGIIIRSDGSGAYDNGVYDLLGPTGTTFGYPQPAVAAKAGDTVVLYGVGFGPTNPPVPSGQAYSGSALAVVPVGLTIGGASVPCAAGMGSAGLYQLNVTIPAGLGTGDLPIIAAAGASGNDPGVQTQSGLVISLQ
jgi:uncharacterized protein (TIGR03437 family)